MTTLFLIALLIEIITEALQPILKPLSTWLESIPNIPETVEPMTYVTMLLGILFAFFFQADLLATLELTAVTPVGILVTGLIVGRGSNFLHDALTRLQVN